MRKKGILCSFMTVPVNDRPAVAATAVKQVTGI